MGSRVPGTVAIGAFQKPNGGGFTMDNIMTATYGVYLHGFKQSIIVTTKTFLGSVTRVGVLLSGDVTVQVDKPSAEAAALAPGTSVSVTLPMEPVLITSRS